MGIIDSLTGCDDKKKEEIPFIRNVKAHHYSAQKANKKRMKKMKKKKK